MDAQRLELVVCSQQPFLTHLTQSQSMVTESVPTTTMQINN